ncbi:MAG TPA: hypothetical protein VJM57_07565 [Thermodesulfobacteriota bacterium]|nr:hypothetical protein [Thermodesulfobacteriota bacterium]
MKGRLLRACPALTAAADAGMSSVTVEGNALRLRWFRPPMGGEHLRRVLSWIT